MTKKHNPNFSKIWLLVPKKFLEQFDGEIANTYSSRSEAIRRGMKLILEEIQHLKIERKKAIRYSQSGHDVPVQLVDEQGANLTKCC